MKAMLPIAPHLSAFSRAGEFLARLEPRSPYGKDRRNALGIETDCMVLEAYYDDIEAAGRALSDKVRADRLLWHLGKMPRLPDLEAGTGGWGLLELFLVKKFLVHYRGLRDVAGEEICAHFDLQFRSQDFYQALCAGNADAESFSITAQHEPALAEVRTRLEALVRRISQRRREQEAAVRALWGLDFAGRDFLIVPVDKALPAVESAARGEGPLLAAEPYDGRMMSVRLLPDTSMLELEEERRRERDAERLLEEKAVARLAAMAIPELPNLAYYSAALGRFDLAIAKWRMVRDYRLVRPVLALPPSGTGSASIRIRAGRFIPLEEECRERNTRYEALDFELDAPVAILAGSNMGGKTCVLQTVAFLQILAQSGMFVPADEFATSVFSWIDVAGEAPLARKRGLSAYGFEIRRLVDILGMAEKGPGLAIFDEFAHTTSAEEARALMQAVVERFADAIGSMALFATHIACTLPAEKGRMFRMAGLDHERAATFFAGSSGVSEDLEELLGHINALMCYRVLPASAATPAEGSDALAVARLLGLDEDIAARAEQLLARSRAGTAS